MARHIDLGKKGEDLAADWVTGNGYSILQRNWRHGRYEVDVITSKSDMIHFVEVKCRQSNVYGPPELGVNRKKIAHILQGAQGWMLDHPGHTRVQYDVLAITLHKDAEPEYVLFEDVYL